MHAVLPCSTRFPSLPDVRRACSLTLLLAPLLYGGLAQAQTQTRYTLQPVRPFFSASGMNDLGQLAGASFLGEPQSAIWTPGADPHLTLLGMPTDVAADINNAGQVAGTHAFATNRTRAAIFSGTGYRDLGTLGGRTSMASAINEHGQVAGTAATASGIQHAFLYTDGAMRDLGALKGGWSHGYGMNDNGDVVGSATMVPIHDAPTHPFLYSGGVMTDLSRSADEFGIATSVNNLGQVVGAIHTGTGQDHAFLYDRGVIVDLGAPSGGASFASSINDKGKVVGASFAPSGESHGFLYTSEGMTDLNTLLDPVGEDWTISQAYLINDLDQIAGFACRPHPDQNSGLDCATVLMSPVPEPAPRTLWTTAILAGLLATRWRKARSGCRSRSATGHRGEHDGESLTTDGIGNADAAASAFKKVRCS